ncbi:hypothetical protein Celal_3285 [Cellulophaga algicola DSM 14237]|uniref:Uncharacterized protein n=1 Tax=Cellulophaga algicola (strain DSM 14237 / IC166 / ACAM 630) TaxID=688270 RepID=E6X5J6_CELAD|nr:hypothetical protein [Cellulophaga algicola]ADV50551.1 hypothetical protein Celal_3285 [Cellulophaga algicola DSM 14237]
MSDRNSSFWTNLFGSSDENAEPSINREELSGVDLENYITDLKAKLKSLWTEENQIRENEIQEKKRVKLDRHKKLMDNTLELEASKKQQGSDSSKKIITGVKTYGQAAAPKAILVLTKVAFDTTYDICSDDVADFSDYKKFYILEDVGKYYHWLYKRTNPDDYSTIKPEPIPITFSSTDKIKLTATLKVTSSDPFTKPPEIRITDKDNKYTFGIEKGKKSGEFEVTFKSNNKPYNDTIQHIQNFELVFEYSEDGSNWVKAGSCINTLYVTWKEPLYGTFKGNSPSIEDIDLKIEATFNKGKENITETLLSIGCKQAKGLGNTTKKTADNQEQILDAIFKEFEPKKITRTREGTVYLDKDLSSQGLGYWRNASSLTGSFTRGLRTLLRDGEARCGEFTSLFIYVALSQGIEANQFAFTSAVGAGLVPAPIPPKFINSIFLVKTWTIKDPKAPIENPPTGNKAQGNDKPMHFFWDHVFATFDKGTEQKYYDPSYGAKGSKFFAKPKELLNIYSSNSLTGVVFAKKDALGEPFLDARHSGVYLDIQTASGGKTPFLYKTMTVDMEKYLAFKLYKTTSELHYFEDNTITIEL